MMDLYSRLVEVLAHELVQEYLTEQAAPDNGSDPQRTKPVPLPAMDKAA